MFIQVIQGKVADAEGLRAALDRWVEQLQPGAFGWLGMTAGITDDGTFVGSVRFESEEAARRNSARPEQGAWWAETEKCFDGPVTFMDCPTVDLWMDGGSDRAGFVQIIEGHTSDAARMMETMRRGSDEVHRMRPEIMGGTVSMYGDKGDFVEAVYFTSEMEARKGERMTPPPEMAAEMSEAMGMMSDMKYLDLHTPWLLSPSR